MPNLTTAEVATMCGVSVRKVNRMVAAGKLRAVQQLPGKTGAYLFRLSDVRKAFPEAADNEQVPA